MRKLIFILINLLLICSVELKAQQMSLDSLLSTIKDRHPELQMYQEKAKAFDSYAKGATTWEAPLISAGFWMTPYNTKLWTPDANSMVSPMGLGAFMVSGTQMIPNFKRLKANEKYMGEMSAIEKANQSFTQNQLFFEAKTNFYNWLILKKKILVLKDNETLLNLIIKTTEQKYPYGKEKLGSIYKAKVSLLELNNQQIELENEIDQMRSFLNTLLNRDKNTIFDIDTNYRLENYEIEHIDTSHMVAHRSDILSIEKTIKLSQLKQNLEKSKAGLIYGIRFDHMQSFGVQPNLFNVMAMMSIPIVPWASKEYKANVVGLDFEIKALERQKEAIVNQASGALQSLTKQIGNKKKQLKLYEKGIIAALRKNHQSALLAYEQNTEELMTVLDALQNLQMAQLEYLNKLGELLLLQVKYEKEIEKL